MIADLKKAYEKAPAVEMYESLDKLHSCRHGDAKPVEDYVNEMSDCLINFNESVLLIPRMFKFT